MSNNEDLKKYRNIFESCVCGEKEEVKVEVEETAEKFPAKVFPEPTLDELEEDAEEVYHNPLWDEDEIKFINYYSHCGAEWDDTGDSMHNDRCPECDDEIEPYKSEDLDTGEIIVHAEEKVEEDIEVAFDAVAAVDGSTEAEVAGEKEGEEVVAPVKPESQLDALNKFKELFSNHVNNVANIAKHGEVKGDKEVK